MTRGSRPKGLGFLLRLAAGGREELLMSLPSERARFTSLGGVVVGTTVMAMLTMAVALHAVFGGTHPLMFVVVPVWGLFVLSIDRWLISDTWRGIGILKLIPRLLLALAIGLVVSESLLLSLFAAEIKEQVTIDRQQHASQLRSRFDACNPVPGAGSAPAGCEAYRLPADSASLEALLLQRASLRAQVNQLQSAYDTKQQQLSQLHAQVMDECLGTKPGAGPRCRDLQAQELALEHGSVGPARNELSDRQADLVALEQEIAIAQRRAQAGLVTAKASRLQETSQSQSGQPSILEQYAALGRLVDDNPTVSLIEWALRLFVITIDCLPVLLRALSGRTAYDQLLEVTNVEDERRQALRTEAVTQKLRVELDLQSRLNERDELPDSFQDSIRAGIEKALKGPPVVNYNGWVDVEVLGPESVALSAVERRIVLSATTTFELEVTISSDQLGAVAEPVALRGGIDQSRVDFVVEVDSDRTSFRRSGRPITVGADGVPGRVRFEFIDVTPPAPPAWIWIRVSQERRTVQNLELTVEAQPALERR
ncbi:DUF4407 domain-containing protein [Micromonospora sp. MH99]|uniref:DUF4407 domain-containing protein n=1 Tax=Micromonospora sp. MH99 TaxID=1945510 RepID=UPI001F168C21|nr:DUF4407 domain-containing protein [Micromonospora sp. MH99]